MPRPLTYSTCPASPATWSARTSARPSFYLPTTPRFARRRISILPPCTPFRRSVSARHWWSKESKAWASWTALGNGRRADRSIAPLLRQKTLECNRDWMDFAEKRRCNIGMGDQIWSIRSYFPHLSTVDLKDPATEDGLSRTGHHKASLDPGSWRICPLGQWRRGGALWLGGCGGWGLQRWWRHDILLGLIGFRKPIWWNNVVASLKFRCLFQPKSTVVENWTLDEAVRSGSAWTTNRLWILFVPVYHLRAPRKA